MSNVDPAELQKFSELAHRWWDPNSEFKPLHEINPLRLDWIASLAGGLAGKRVVDIGCGGGILAESIARAGATTVGIDLARKPLKIARLHSLESGISVDYREISAEELAAAEPASFDVVTCMEMLEHVPSPAAVVEACARLVKPGGKVFFSTLNRNPKSYLFAIVGAEYLLRLLPAGTHEYQRFIKPSELTGYARAAGLDVIASIGLHYNPLSRVYSLGKSLDVNYLLACTRP
ncbi:bifunctional 2-polyprenyl-6-hydroxyphenol methylase/3-demethylubiquinol 3-O-methyltransferase UbiG [Derxia lacustris]|uniref:bifunctional 2-polyprenyl-6-hydroxyphenol methylase/3-demethylubiquinol 3-O-methyltransferase UbiG n=1 Tax=Derxia lacustris TaxID=764842 RepID=UPI000A16DDAC|nr:bifunctional 2-polyprenyl-6-hydroxyphenol methylase/3-demethylubiquinol 3-O-methyltransferase UbiG [Derxia lacustris]